MDSLVQFTHIEEPQPGLMIAPDAKTKIAETWYSEPFLRNWMAQSDAPPTAAPALRFGYFMPVMTYYVQRTYLANGAAMPRAMVGVLAALSTALAAMTGLVHGRLVPVAILGAAAAIGLANFLSLTRKKIA